MLAEFWSLLVDRSEVSVIAFGGAEASARKFCDGSSTTLQQGSSGLLAHDSADLQRIPVNKKIEPIWREEQTHQSNMMVVDNKQIYLKS